MTTIRQATARAVDAILDGQDPAQQLASIPPEQRQNALAAARSCASLPVWHAEKIAALPTVEARRAALEGLPVKLQPAVKRRLSALWKARA